MLHRFEIESFRKLESISLENLTDFNLIVGKNNSGKTSILEAVAVGLAMGEARDIFSIARKRDSRSNVVLAGPSYLSDVVSWMFPAPATSFWDIDFSGEIALRYSESASDIDVSMSCRRIFLDTGAEQRLHSDPIDEFEPLRGIEVTTVIREKLPLEDHFQEVDELYFSLGAKSVERETITTKRSVYKKIPFEYIRVRIHNQ